MKKIEWDESLSVQDETIDSQHRKWIDIYNEMIDFMEDPKTVSLSDKSRNAVSRMLDYVRFHFESEREYMEEIGYPDIVSHIRLHKEFDNKVYGLSRDLENGKTVLNSEILNMIRDWLLDHIMEEDQKYSLYRMSKSGK